MAGYAYEGLDQPSIPKMQSGDLLNLILPDGTVTQHLVVSDEGDRWQRTVELLPDPDNPQGHIETQSGIA